MLFIARHRVGSGLGFGTQLQNLYDRSDGANEGREGFYEDCIGNNGDRRGGDDDENDHDPDIGRCGPAIAFSCHSIILVRNITFLLCGGPSRKYRQFQKETLVVGS